MKFLLAFFLIALISFIFVFGDYFGLGFMAIRDFFWGIDIAGGSVLTYEIDKTTSTIINQEILEQTKNLLEKRINFLGVQESFISFSQSGKFIIELPNITSTEEATKIIGKTPYLEFRIPFFITSSGLAINNDKNSLLIDESLESTQTPVIFIPSGLTGKHVIKASYFLDSQTNKPVVSLTFNNEGSVLFRELTKKYLGQPIAIFLDGNLISQPIVQNVIYNGQAQITSNSSDFTIESAKNLSFSLNQGALPVPLKLLAISTINPILGEKFFANALRLSLIGIFLVMLFIIVIYGFNGLIANISLLFFILFNLALYKLLGVTISLAAISGLVLATGMAIDANILIFERMREEKKINKSGEDLIVDSFKRAFTSIRDSNFTTIITSLIIYFLATSFVKGFALTLFFGTLISFLTAIFFVKNLLLVIYKKHKE